MSNRLTFSLASLILIFAFGFVAMPVMAADGGPTVTIAKDGTPTRAAYTLKFTFNIPVEGFNESGDVEFRYYGENNQLLDSWNNAQPVPVTNKPREYTLSLNVSNPATGAKGFTVRVPADKATGLTNDNNKGNQASSANFELPPLVSVGSLALSVAENTTQDPATSGKDYVLTLTYENAAGTAAALDPIPTVGNLTFNPAYLKAAAVGNAADADELPSSTTGVYTFNFIHPTGAPDLTIDVEDVYFTGATPAAGVVVPIPVPAKQNPPTVTLTVSEHNKTNRVFRVDVSTTPANDTKGNAGAAIAGSAIKAALSVKDSSTPAIDVGVNLLDGDTGNERSGDNSYIAYLEYGVFDKLPLTVSIDPNDLATNPDAADVAPVADGVGGDPTTPPVAGAPGMPTGLTATADQTAKTIALSWTAPTDDGGSAITGYTITQSKTGATDVTATSTTTSHTTGVLTAGTYSFTVAATNATGTGASSAAVTATIEDDAVALAQPTNVKATAKGDGSIMVTWAWEGADATETAALDGFTVTWNPSMNVDADKRSYTIPADRLTADQSTNVSVLARAKANSNFGTPAVPSDTAKAAPVTPVNPADLRFVDPVTGDLVTKFDNLTLTAGTAITDPADNTKMYIQLPSATGGVGDITYSLRKGVGEVDVTSGDNGLMVNLTDLRLYGTPTAADKDGTEYQWRATDARGEADVKGVKKLNFTITVAEAGNRAPVYDPATALKINGVVAMKITPVDVSATDPDGDKLTYSWDVDETALGLALDTSTGMISGTPLKVHTGTHPVTASDGELSDMRDVEITITAETTAPTVEITLLSKDANGKHAVDANGDVRFELLFSEPLIKTGVGQLELKDIYIIDRLEQILLSSGKLSDPIQTAMPATTGLGNKEKYILTIPDRSNRDPQEMLVELSSARLYPFGGQVADIVGNQYFGYADAVFDTVPPDVSISVVGAKAKGGNTFSGEPMSKLTFRFAFTEPLSPAFTTTDIHRSVSGDNFKLLDDSDPRQVPGVANAYDVVVTVIDPNEATTVLIKRLEISDAAKNQLQNDRYATYSPTTTAPVASITAPDIFDCGIDGNQVTVTIADSEGIASGQGIAASEITISTGWQIETGSFRATAGATSATARFSVVRKDVENGSDRSWLGIQEVTVTVAADAVMDDTNQGNAAKSDTNTAGPVITVPGTEKVPGGGYVVVVRDTAWATSHLNYVRTLFLGDYNVRAQGLQVQPWDCMPDLGLIFDITTKDDPSPGVGGGGLMVLQSRDHTGATIAKGTVGISEIMWSEDRGIPFGRRSNLEHAREQWIELHNTNKFDVKVTLFELIREEAYRTNDAGRAGLIDVMSNYDIGGRWDAKGSDGNSELGKDFVSMQRAKNGNGYDHVDNNGRDAGKWTASAAIYLTRRAGLAGSGQVPLEDLNYHFMGSPGRSNTFSAPGPIERTDVPSNSIVFNEIANRRDQTLEWIELKNVSALGTDPINLKNYEISYVTAKGTDTRLYVFPNNDNAFIAPGELLLIVDTDPRDNDAHPIAVGYNILAGNDQALGIGENPGKHPTTGKVDGKYTGDAPRYMVTNFAEGGLPDDGKFVLILRNGNDKRGTHEKIIDIAGYDDDLKDDSIHTNLWPLKYHGVPDARNTLAVETVHRRQHMIDPDETDHKDKKDGHMALGDVGYTGIGYKRHAQRIAAHGGTPGHHHSTGVVLSDATISKGVATTVGQLTISEIMFDQGDGDYPQWIEIYNSSNEPVNLHSEAGWRLVVQNFDDGEIRIGALSGTLNFKNSQVQTILPQQTVMITSTRARNSGSAFFDTRVVFPATRVFSVWDDARGELDMKRSTDEILSDKGFYLELIDGKNTVSDSIGNLVSSPNRRVAATKTWELSEVKKLDKKATKDPEQRSSILRSYRKPAGGDSRTWTKYTAAELLKMGIVADGWIAAYTTDFREVRETWYGHQDDIGSPGITGGRVLPVSLSKFRPERLDSGEIVIRWITQSELNNAGFNILRSEKSDAEFKQINTKLIAGQGTTSEKTTYEWKDTTAKPNVVYYYQIQDVSLDGKVQTLRISRLKGNVSAEGKLTTTWGELKALQ